MAATFFGEVVKAPCRAGTEEEEEEEEEEEDGDEEDEVEDGTRGAHTWRPARGRGQGRLLRRAAAPRAGTAASMAPSPRTSSRQDATALPSMSSTFWAFMILASLLIAYCSQLAAGTCEIVTLDRDSSQPRRTIARQTARCACRKGQIAGTTRARPACVDARIIKTKQWCDMLPCLEGEGCDLLINRSGWTCTQPGGRIKTTTVS
ncbi:chemokine-like protein TAFA-5 isoform X2 [Psammomys obesus]|uniref:chemokine-like protein TAFA-5 isoform X2 n=1 Tax=Psammomys obesus TaxID=48139 RepID=UPI002452F853|nr:chemokine-like protein TAFA-5 isoform X2 [Psammomys obesus]